jgi:hypothetical protein
MLSDGSIGKTTTIYYLDSRTLSLNGILKETKGKC